MDDIFITSNDSCEIEKLDTNLNVDFSLKRLGALKYFWALTWSKTLLNFTHVKPSMLKTYLIQPTWMFDQAFSYTFYYLYKTFVMKIVNCAISL